MAAYVNVYCVKHEENHNLTILEAIKLLHIYQFNMVHYAYDKPLPEVPNVSNPDIILSRVLCPLHDLETIDKDKHPLSRVGQYVQYMLNLRADRSKKRRNGQG